MIGLIVLAISVPLLLAYLWLVRAAVRYTKRKTGSNLLAALAVVCILVITFGDTVFNRWYHKEVLCKREEVGVRIFEKVELPKEYLDKEMQLQKLPFPLSQAHFFAKFSLNESVVISGLFPFTANGRIERIIVDNESDKVLAQFVDYWPAGGPWWGMPFEWFGESSLIGWLRSRQQLPSCFNNGTQNSLLSVSGYFYAIYQGE